MALIVAIVHSHLFKEHYTAMRNANSHVQNLNSDYPVYFLRRQQLHHATILYSDHFNIYIHIYIYI